MRDREREALEEGNARIYGEIADTVADIAFDIRMESYDDAEKKTDLLARLLKTLADGGKRR